MNLVFFSFGLYRFYVDRLCGRSGALLADERSEAIKSYVIRTMLRNVLLSLTGIVLALGAQVSHAQHDMSALKPPAGSHVALIEFADMECPDVRAAESDDQGCGGQIPHSLAEARFSFADARLEFSGGSKCAVVRHAAQKARQRIRRDYIFANQISIETKDDLRTFTEKFAQ